ncbi:MAG: hypothetical protein MJ231_07545, partial [bacterium]|nr:hypothetical protein [bacterium]
YDTQTKEVRMQEVSGYNITQKEFKQLNQRVENIYNTSVVIDYFCVNQPEIEELNNLTPIVSKLLKCTLLFGLKE